MKSRFFAATLALTTILAMATTVVSASFMEESDEELWSAFAESMEKSGVSMDAVTRNDKGELVAAREVMRGSKVVAVPGALKIDLSVALAEDSPIAEVMNDMLSQGLTKKQALVVMLLHETHRQDRDSQFAAYIDALPDAYPWAPFFYPPELKNEMQGTLAAVVAAQEKEAGFLWGIVQQLTVLHPSAFDPELVTEEETRWAFYTVQSRAWSGDDAFIVPVADAIGTGPDANVVMSMSKSGRTVVTAVKPIPEGTPLVLMSKNTTAAHAYASSGVLGDAPLLHSNYLELQYTPATYSDLGDVFALTVDELVRIAGCFEPPAPRFHYGGQISPAFIACLRLAYLTPGDYARVVRYEEDTETPWDRTAMFSLENERDVLGMLASSFRDSFGAYATTATQDESILAGMAAETADVDPRLQAIVRIRYSEKMILQSAVDALEALWMELLYADPDA